MSKELIIDKNTNLSRLENKEEYTKLVIKRKINPKKLDEFINVRELVIDYDTKKGNVNYNERNINLLSFKEKLEKLTFNNILCYGEEFKNSSFHYYSLIDFYNLKVIEFPGTITTVNSDYLRRLDSLETIIFNLNNVTSFSGRVEISSPLKNIIIKYNDIGFNIDLDYQLDYINGIKVGYLTSSLRLEYEGEYEETVVEIDLKNNILKKHTSWSIYDRDNYRVFIPDYVNELGNVNMDKAMELSMNLKLLDDIDEFEFIDNNNYINLETIELRTNNDMKLIPNKILKPKEYGKLLNLYIDNNLLNLEYERFILNVDTKGNVKTQEKDIVEENVGIGNKALNDYTLSELEEYFSYLKLLKLVSDEDIEYKNAMEVVKDRVLKKIKK